jgi:hypothetical protein
MGPKHGSSPFIQAFDLINIFNIMDRLVYERAIIKSILGEPTFIQYEGHAKAWHDTYMIEQYINCLF